MDIIRRDSQIEILWKKHETVKESQQLIEKVIAMSIATMEITAYEIRKERQEEVIAELMAAGVMWTIRDTLKSADAFIDSVTQKIIERTDACPISDKEIVAYYEEQECEQKREDREEEIKLQLIAIGFVWQIQDSIKEADIFIESVTKENPSL